MCYVSKNNSEIYSRGRQYLDSYIIFDTPYKIYFIDH